MPVSRLPSMKSKNLLRQRLTNVISASKRSLGRSFSMQYVVCLEKSCEPRSVTTTDFCTHSKGSQTPSLTHMPRSTTSQSACEASSSADFTSFSSMSNPILTSSGYSVSAFILLFTL